MRKLERYIAQYGPEVGPKMFHLLQSQAGHASVSARLRRKIAVLTGAPTEPRSNASANAIEVQEELPLFCSVSATAADSGDERIPAGSEAELSASHAV